LSGIGVSCACGRRFEVPASMRGGLANCPACGKAAAVRGGPEPLFWGLLSVGIAGVLLISVALWAFVGFTAGAIALGVGAVVLTAVVLAS
jgi:hypothetical protein